MTKLTLKFKGGQGSGNFGHKGREGQVGGSSTSGGGGSSGDSSESGKQTIDGGKMIQQYPLIYEALGTASGGGGGALFSQSNLPRNQVMTPKKRAEWDKYSATLTDMKKKKLSTLSRKKFTNSAEDYDMAVEDDLSIFDAVNSGLGELMTDASNAYGKDGIKLAKFLDTLWTHEMD